jgi:hydrogenase-4 component B
MFENLFLVGLFTLFIGFIAPLVGLRVKNDKNPRYLSCSLTSIASVLLIIFSAEIILTSNTYTINLYQLTPLFNFNMVIDRLAAFFVLLISVVSFAVSIYSTKYVDHMHTANKRNFVISLMNLFILSMVLVVSASGMFSFLFFWEIMAITSFLLVMTEYEKQETGKAGIYYFVMTQLSTIFLLFAFIYIYSSTGSFNIQQIPATPLVTSVAFVFLFIGFSIKAGVIPFHKWLPYAHPASPSNVSALMSGVMIKVAIYGLVRFVLLMQVEMWMGLVITVAGAVSAILGVIYALKEHDIKRLLAYHSIENIGIILLGIGLYAIFSSVGLAAVGSLALIGALFHTLNHALFKSLLFMTSGSIINATGTRNIEEMGGLIKRMPKTAFLFLIGAISISALPPFNGFVSELMIFQAFFQSYLLTDPFLELVMVILLAVFALTSALAAACFVKAFGITFLASPRSHEAKEAKESPKPMLIGSAVLAGLCIALGVFSYQIFSYLGFALPLPNMLFIGLLLLGSYVVVWAVLRGRAERKERLTETWGCGIQSQNSKMEYTASGFSEPIVTIFKSIFRTQKVSKRTFNDDKNANFKSGEAEITLLKFFEERLYQPVADFVKKISLVINNLQRGDVDLHIAYAFVTIVVFLLIIWWFA